VCLTRVCDATHQSVAVVLPEVQGQAEQVAGPALGVRTTQTLQVELHVDAVEILDLQDLRVRGAESSLDPVTLGKQQHSIVDEWTSQ